MTEILIIGAGGHARVVADVLRLSGAYHIYGFIDGLNPKRNGEAFEAGTILGDEMVLAELKGKVTHAVVAIGDNRARMRLAELAVRHGYTMPALVHPGAVVADTVTLGAGSVVFAGAVINPATVIGDHVIINTAATVDHDCQIEEGAHIAPGAHLGGHVTVGRGALVGLGAAVKPGVVIGAGAIVGLGAAVIDDVPAGHTVAGNPARLLS